MNHSCAEYVRGAVHTNSIESVWALLKRAICGTWHHVSAKHVVSNIISLDGSKIISVGVRRKSHVDSLPQRAINERGQTYSRISAGSVETSSASTSRAVVPGSPELIRFPTHYITR